MDNVVDVTETINTEFSVCNKRGILRFIPEWLEYTGKDEKTIKKRSVLKNLRAKNENFILDKVNGKDRIRIGDEDKYIGCVEKEYVIKYTYDMGKDLFDGFDEFIFHAFGDYWYTPINNAEITINMPKAIEGYKISFFGDKYREKDYTKVVDYEVNGKTLHLVFNEEKFYQMQREKYYLEKGQFANDEQFNRIFYTPLKNSLTIDIELPEGYFVGGSW